MSGVPWVASIWTVTLIVWYWADRRAGRPRKWLNREAIAVMLALLGTKSIAAATDAEELLRDPAVPERILRGGLAALALLVAAPVLVQRLRGPDRETGFRNLGYVVAYLGIATITTLYSVAPLVTGAKVFEMAAGIVPVLAAAIAYDGRRRLRDMAGLLVVLESGLLVVATLGFFVMPEQWGNLDVAAGEVRPGFITDLTLVSPWAHSNYLSAMGAFLSCFALAWLFEAKSVFQRVLYFGLFALGILGTLLAAGRQGIVILLISIAVLLWFRRRTLFTLAIGPAVGVTLWLNWDSVIAIFARGQPERLSNLSGRLNWWESAIDAWAQHPWTGYGFGAGGRFVALGGSRVSNVHSGYVEALVGVGLLGLIPLVVALLLVSAWSVGALKDGRDVPFAILIVPMAIHTSVSRGFGAWLSTEVVLFVCLVGIADWWRRDHEATSRNIELIGAV